MQSNEELIEIINKKDNKIEFLENLLKQYSNNHSIHNNNNNNHDTTQTHMFDVKQTNYENNILYKYICLVCNQLFTSDNIFDHSQQNKDHIDHCLDINNIQNQLSDINNGNSKSNNKNNIFKRRIETIFSSLKRLSSTYSSLNSKLNEISNHFKIYYDYLISKEHSLKKQIQVDIESVNINITHLINEFKSIINLVNISNSSSEVMYTGSELEDTTDQYSFSSFIESIQKSESYNSHIENNKNTLFNKNKNNENNNNNLQFLSFIENHNRFFNSSLLNPTESNLHSPKNKLYIVDAKQKDQVCYALHKMVEESIIIHDRPSTLVRYGDLETIKQYYKLNNINRLEYYDKIKSKEQLEVKETIIEILKSNRIDILTYLIQDLHFDMKTHFTTEFNFLRSFENFDLLCMSTLYSRIETIQFLESLGTKNHVKWKYNICLEVSPFSNNIKVLQYFSSKVVGFSVSVDSIYVSGNAALLGHIDMIEWISQNNRFSFKYQIPNTLFCIDVAAPNGHLNIIKWLHKNRTEGCTTNAMDYAALNGHLETIKWLHHNRTEGCTTNAMDYASQNGHLETIKWLHENRTEGCTTKAMDYAAANGHLETIKWLYKNNFIYSINDSVDDFNPMENIKWVHEKRTEGCTTLAKKYTSHSVYLETIKWLHENRTEGCTVDAMNGAVLNGDLEIVKWLHENRTKGCTINIIEIAAKYGHLEIIKWLHQHIIEAFTTKSAKIGHLEVDCTTDAMDNAAENGHLETIKWLHENRTEGCTDKAMDNAAKNGHLDTIKWLHRNRTEGCTTKAMDIASLNGHLKAVKWLHQYRTEGCTEKAMLFAANKGHLEIIKWLHLNRTEGSLTEALKTAQYGKHLEVIEWLNSLKSKKVF